MLGRYAPISANHGRATPRYLVLDSSVSVTLSGSNLFDERGDVLSEARTTTLGIEID